MSQTLLETLQHAQGKWYARLLKLKQLPDETGRQYGIRKARLIRDCAGSSWPLTACKTLVSWLSHLQRHPTDPVGEAYRTHDYSWLEEQRREHTGVHELVSRTGTRRGRGRVFRWDQDGWTKEADPKRLRDNKALTAAAKKLMSFMSVDTRGRGTD